MTVIKFHVLLGKVQWVCHNLLKKGLWAHTPLYETVLWRMNAINTRWENIADIPYRDVLTKCVKMYEALEHTAFYMQPLQ
jgi:hypothetical protein